MAIRPASEECKECYDELRAYWANRAGVSPAEPDEMELCPVCHGTNEGTDGPPCPKCDNIGDVPRQANNQAQAQPTTATPERKTRDQI